MAAVRHHFVPQGFLRGFAIDEATERSFVWVYDKRPERAVRRKAIRSIAWAPTYYARELKDGTPDTGTLEHTMATTIDNVIPTILGEITPSAGRKLDMPGESRGALAFFLGLSMTRVPSFRDGINETFTRMAQFKLQCVAEQDPKIRDFVKKYGVTAEAKPWVSLDPMIKLAGAIGDSVLRKSWQFFVPPRDFSLVTSDNPVVFSGAAFGLAELGPADPAAELLMNLRRDLALVCTPKPQAPHMEVFQSDAHEAKKLTGGSLALHDTEYSPVFALKVSLSS